MSAYAYMHGQHGYNKMPMASMGCAALIHLKPNTRQTLTRKIVQTLPVLQGVSQTNTKHMNDGHGIL